MESTDIITDGAPVAEGVPEKANAITKKRQRQKHTHHWPQFTRALFPSGRFPAKFGCQPIKLELYPLPPPPSPNRSAPPRPDARR